MRRRVAQAFEELYLGKSNKTGLKYSRIFTEQEVRVILAMHIFQQLQWKALDFLAVSFFNCCKRLVHIFMFLIDCTSCIILTFL